MGKILEFFKRKDAIGEVVRDRADIVQLLRPHSIPALSLEPSGKSGLSCFGGTPLLPDGVEWPRHGDTRLTFIACLSLDEIEETNVIPWLPKRGQLLFFYDMEDQPWGFDPKEADEWFDGDMQIGHASFQVGGYPNPVQNDTMELQCQLTSNGLYCGDSSGYDDPQAAELEAGAADW